MIISNSPGKLKRHLLFLASFNPKLSFKKHIGAVVKMCNFQIRNMYAIMKFFGSRVFAFSSSLTCDTQNWLLQFPLCQST